MQHRRTAGAGRIARLAAAALAVGLLAGAPAMAGEHGEEQRSSPEEMAREGAERILRAIEGLLDMIPQYGTPYVDEDGNIVIPRIDTPRGEEEPPDEGEDEAEPPAVTETKA